MRPPAELHDVPWHTLTHAYGPADDVPELLGALYDEDGAAADEAIHELFGTIHHQGTVYSASAPAVPFLAHAARHVPDRADRVLMLIAALAGHDPEDIDAPYWPDSPTAAVCAELCRLLPDLLPCLDSPERPVRRAALRVVAAVAGLLPPGPRAAATARIDALYAGDPVPAVRADAAVVLARFGREVAALDSPLPEVRLAAAVLAAGRREPPWPAGLVGVIAADGAEPDPGDDDFPWSGGETRDEALTRLLLRDPDAGLTVAGQWIAAGDLGFRGSWLAEEIARTWRDREPAVVGLLLAALPHRRDARSLAHGLRTVGHWAALLPEPGAGLRDALHHHARAEDGEVAVPALLALARARDPRALGLLPARPDAQALRSAAASFPGAADRLIPVIRRELAAGATGNEGSALVDALGAFGAAARAAQPELLDCLRTRRAPVAAARLLGLHGTPEQEVITLLAEATGSAEPALRAAAAAAHHRLTGDAGPALRTFDDLLTSPGPTHWHLDALHPLGAAAVPLLPLVEPMLTSGYEWTRAAAAEAHHRITGSPDRAVPVLTGLVGATPVGLRALRALAAAGDIPGELRPALRSFADSPRRVLGDSLPFDEGHPDEDLRALARTLLATG
ncbi:hypothetical protein [Streptomyces sp. RFCAC02]|uniref:hypothetical protein n=1 Tax=Streptomyces sp. RFCAC02 TaxID=2499143 RepID=UPI00101ECF9A|nr:hypothetical protein [Streptomyces sp. RFCAC02]